MTAAKKCFIEDYIDEMRDGYETAYVNLEKLPIARNGLTRRLRSKNNATQARWDELQLPPDFDEKIGAISLARVEPGEYDWHNHPDSWEVFYMLQGVLIVQVQDHMPALLKAGIIDHKIIEIPPNVGHKISTEEGATFFVILCPTGEGFG